MAAVYLNLLAPSEQLARHSAIKALQQEIALKSGFLQHRLVNSIYITGPDLTSYHPYQLKDLLQSLGQGFRISSSAEVTVETNPLPLRSAFIRRFQEAGINRLVINAETLSEAAATTLALPHSASQAIRAVSCAIDEGLTNCSVNLCYGFPGQSLADWAHDLEAVYRLGVPHLSATAWLNPSADNEGETVTAPAVADQYKAAYHVLREFAGQYAFRHYDIVHLARPGFESQQNIAYTIRAPYVGIGPGAHSFSPSTRYWNCQEQKAYLSMLDQGRPPLAGQEHLSNPDIANELLILGLRSSRGSSLQQLASLLPAEAMSQLRIQLKEAWKQHRIRWEADSTVYFNPDYWLEVDEWLESFLVLPS